MWPVARHAVCGPDRRLAIADGIKGQPDSREEDPPPVATVALSANVLWITGKNHSRRGIGENRALVILSKQCGIDIMNLPPLVGYRNVGFPTHAVVQRKSPVRLPGILRIEALVILTRVEPIRRTLHEASGVSDEQISQSEAGYRPIKDGRAHGVQTRPVVHLLMVQGTAETKLLGCPDPVDVFRNRAVRAIVRFRSEERRV